MVRIQATLTGLLLAVVATGLVARSAEASAIDRTTLYEFNDCTSGSCTPTSIQTTPADEIGKLALQDINDLMKLDDTGFPTILNDPNSDYFLRLTADLNPLMKPTRKISEKNPLTATITFDIGWYGTVQGMPPPYEESESTPELLILLTAMRQGSFGPVDPAIDSAYVRNSSVGIEGVNATELIFSDCLVLDVGCGPSFVGDGNSGLHTERYLGFETELRAPLSGMPGSYTEADLDFVSFSIDWALMQEPLALGDFQLVNSGYIVPNVPEPGVILLLGAGALFLTRRRRA